MNSGKKETSLPQVPPAATPERGTRLAEIDGSALVDTKTGRCFHDAISARWN